MSYRFGTSIVLITKSTKNWQSSWCLLLNSSRYNYTVYRSYSKQSIQHIIENVRMKVCFYCKKHRQCINNLHKRRSFWSHKVYIVDISILIFKDGTINSGIFMLVNCVQLKTHIAWYRPFKLLPSIARIGWLNVKPFAKARYDAAGS